MHACSVQTGSIYFGHAGLHCTFFDSSQVPRYFLQRRSPFTLDRFHRCNRLFVATGCNLETSILKQRFILQFLWTYDLQNILPVTVRFLFVSLESFEVAGLLQLSRYIFSKCLL